MPPSNNPPRRPANGGAFPRNRRAVATPVPQVVGRAKMIVQAGPAAGQEFELRGDELVLGRATDNAISLPDTSVSRKHALVRKTENNSWALSDLGSGNGTLLNGEPVIEEVELSPGDVITLGDSELQFEGPPAAPAALARAPVRSAARASGGGAIERAGSPRRPVRTSRMGSEDPVRIKQKKRKTFIRVGAIAILVLSMGMGVQILQKKRQERADVLQKQKREHDGEMATMLKEAKALVRAGDWAQAKTKLAEIAETDPEYEPKQVANYLKTAELEIPNQEAMSEALDALKASKLSKAFKVITEIKSSATKEGEFAVRRIREEINDKATEKVTEARTLMATANDVLKLEAVVALADDVLGVHADDRDGIEIKKQAESAIYRIKNPNVAPPPPEKPWLEVQQRYRSGDSSGSLSLAQACGEKHAQCRSLEAQIRNFETKSKQLEELNEDALYALFELDKKIAGGQSSELARSVRTQMVSKLYVKASQARTTGNWSRAVELARRVLQADPSNNGAASLISEGRRQASDVYLRGYQLKATDPDQAKVLFKEVLSMTPADDEYHQKAANKIAEIDGQ
jgi:pSer/pThr/pTyr-binding forkhead associated (FHA) protein/tetratricopeptide (TPR) repeat protein